MPNKSGLAGPDSNKNSQRGGSGRNRKASSATEPASRSDPAGSLNGGKKAGRASIADAVSPLEKKGGRR